MGSGFIYTVLPIERCVLANWSHCYGVARVVWEVISMLQWYLGWKNTNFINCSTQKIGSEEEN